MQIQHDSLLRLPEVLARIPVSRATWYAGVKSGRYPPPVSLGPRCVAWKASDIQQLVTQGASDSSPVN
ncbi:helix-turn-helix transcriptional regulator [Paraburkholderia silviterrae]|uniref:AlpA family phage regulatory protein n=1 Tax=Paraburkholderia silviterrae TaxID=2528715 RepID=A0A4R5MBH7_9BURK|nr:AlpA family phage regulatory protein [Paraburkholderia silviterrae]TDG24151.1 AlpA family phage regulatory protein [Paraburkholderia silviterrae]